MEKFFLGTFFINNKLNIVNEQHIHVPVFLPEFGGSDVVLVADGVNQLVGKFFAGDVNHLGGWVLF